MAGGGQEGGQRRMLRQIVTHHLEMTDPAQLVPARGARVEFSLVRVEIPCPPLNRFLYAAVGGDWYWIDRLTWTHAQWQSYLDRNDLETWVAYVRGAPAGYFELEAQAEGNVEIAYFGLLAQFIGQGLGGALLTAAIERAWEMGARRVWVHTCSLDHPSALPAYQARGFRVFDVVTHEQDLPDKPPGPWPGAFPSRPNDED
jgi:GNAT superfamily N-acetyltransferase